ncbi:outer membrane protein [Mycoplana dimorpha]|nr:outer membrane protein [Mycoplana dimorpha]
MKFLTSTALLALVAAPALAADVVSYQEPAPQVEASPAFSWTGGYVGLQGGGAWLNGDFSIPGASASEDFNGGLIGGFAGYNFQQGNWVFGVEGDVSYNWNDNNYDIFGTTAEVGTDVSGSVRGRAGYAFDSALIYATAGWTATRGFVDVPGFDKETEVFNGWTIGAGADYAFTNNIFGRAEYRYNDFGDKDIQGVNVDLDQHQVTLGIGVKF